MFGYLRKRDVIITMTQFEFKQRYRGTALGLIWSLLAPFLLALVLFLVFRNMFSWVENFAAYVLVGVFVFRFFQVATSVGMNAVVGKSHLVTKTNIDRELLPLATTLSYGMSSFLEILVIVPIVHVLGGTIGLTILFLPVLHFVYIIFVFGLNLFLSSLMVYFRDLNQIWEVITNVIFFASPIVYPLKMIPESYREMYMLNPIACIIEIYRGILMENQISLEKFFYFLLISLALAFAGQLFFRRMQKRFGEVL